MDTIFEDFLGIKVIDPTEKKDERHPFLKTTDELAVDKYIADLQTEELEKQFADLKLLKVYLENHMKSVNKQLTSLEQDIINKYQCTETEKRTVKGIGTFSVNEKENHRQVNKHFITETLQAECPKELKGLQSINAQSFNTYMKEIRETNKDLYDKLVEDGAVHVSTFNKLSFRRSNK